MEPETSPFLLRVGILVGHLAEGSEKKLDVVLGDSDPGILNFEDERLGFGQDRAQSHRALVGKFDGVAQKVDQDLAKAHLVGFNNFGQVLVPIQFEFDPFALGGPSHHLYSLLEEGVK